MEDEVSPESLSNLLLSFKAMGGGLWDYDIDRDFLLCNRRWYEILGLDPAVTVIRSIADFRPFVHQDDADVATRIDADEIDLLFANDDKYSVDFRIIRTDGEIRWLRSVACLVENPETGARHAIGCVTDITEFMMSAPARAPMMSGLDKVYPEQDAVNSSGVMLSDKERECLMWVSLGKTAWETARILGRSSRTVEFHLKNATAKLNASNKIHAAALAIRKGLL